MPLLSAQDIRRLSKWSYAVEDRSISTKLLSPFWNWAVQYVPAFVAPNLLSLSGLVCLVHAWYICHLYMHSWPISSSIISALLLFSYQTLDAIDGKHARRIGNSSPMGELFDHACDNVGVIFLTLALCHILGVQDTATQWHLVQMIQFIFLQEHLTAFRSKVVTFSALTGPGEALWACIAIAIYRACFGIDWLWSIVTPETLAEIVRYLYGLCLLHVCFTVARLPQQPHSATKFGFAMILSHRAIRAVLFAQGRGWWWGAPDDSTTMLLTILIDGLFMSMVTSDIIVAKMASRSLSPFVVVFSMVAIVDNLIALITVVGYYVTLFHEISQGLHLPIFSTFRNVYVDGIFDLCHLGHRNLISRAAELGDRVFVGVCSDEEAGPYKRVPIMTLDERVAAVESCKDVYHVIRSSPVSGITAEMIDTYNIHIVCADEEYCDPAKPDKYKYYLAAHERGIVQAIPRTQGMSTSDLIRRVLECAPQKDWDAAAKIRADKERMQREK